METADDVIDSFWGTDMVENRKFSHIVAKGFDTQVSKLFKFLKLGCLRKKLCVNLCVCCVMHVVAECKQTGAVVLLLLLLLLLFVFVSVCLLALHLFLQEW